jgi:hypothetical protein
MTLRIYNSGTVSVSPGATSIVGSGSFWVSTINAAVPYDRIVINGTEVTIEAVVDDTHLTIEPWTGAAQVAQPYKIFQTSLDRVTGSLPMKNVGLLVAAFNSNGFYFFVKPGLTPDPSLGDDGQYARDPTNGKEWLKYLGAWVYQGISGSLSFSAMTWSATTTYALSVLVPYAGKIWISQQPTNTNHQPGTDTSWWVLFLANGDVYDLALDASDRPDSGDTFRRFVFTHVVQYYAGMTDSRAVASVAATAMAVFSIQKNGVEFATLTFAAGGTIGTFACPTATTFNPGDMISVVAPNPRDATLATLAITLTGYR